MDLVYSNKKSFEEVEELINIEKINDLNLNLLEDDEGFIACGDNFKIMSSMLEVYENKIDLVYIDPPFNTNAKFLYNKERVSTISTEKNSDVAYDDNMDFDSYLEFIRERLILINKLLSPNGTLYFHIDLKVGHYIKILLDEIFGYDNYVNDITRVKSNPKNFSRKAYGNEKDVIYIYSKNKNKNIFNDIKIPLEQEDVERLFSKVDENGERYTTVPCHAPGETTKGVTGQMWRDMLPPKGRHWRCSPEELEKLNEQGAIEWSKNGNPRIKKYAKNHQGKKMQDIWTYKDPQYPIYPTEKNNTMLDMIVKQSSHENSIIMDCFCGSGSFLKAGIKNNRKVIGIDKSEIAYEICLNSKELSKLKKVIVK